MSLWCTLVLSYLSLFQQQLQQYFNATVIAYLSSNFRIRNVWFCTFVCDFLVVQIASFLTSDFFWLQLGLVCNLHHISYLHNEQLSLILLFTWIELGIWSWKSKWRTNVGSTPHCWYLWNRNFDSVIGQCSTNSFNVSISVVFCRLKLNSALFLNRYQFFCLK